MAVGFALLQPSIGMMQQPMMLTPSSMWGGYFLLILGVVVLSTGVYVLTAGMMKKQTLIGELMLAYGVIMLIVGSSMFLQIFPMMQGSTLSGIVMVVVGIAMLYSGYGMTKSPNVQPMR